MYLCKLSKGVCNQLRPVVTLGRTLALRCGMSNGVIASVISLNFYCQNTVTVKIVWALPFQRCFAN